MKKMKFFRMFIAIFAIFSIVASLCFSASAVSVPSRNNIFNGTSIVFTIAPAGGIPISYRGYLTSTESDSPALLLQDSKETLTSFPSGSSFNITINFPNPVSFYNQSFYLSLYVPDNNYYYDVALSTTGIAHGVSSTGSASPSEVSLAIDTSQHLTVSGNALFARQDFLVSSIEFTYANSNMSLGEVLGLITALQGGSPVAESPTGNSGFYLGFTQRYFDSYNYGWQVGFPSGSTSAQVEFDKIIVQERLDSYENGYNYGYIDGKAAAADEYDFNDLLLGIAGVPFGFLSSMFNFNIMGVNIAGVVFMIITLAVVAFLVSKFI